MTILRIHFSPGQYESLYRLQKSLDATEKLIYAYLFKILREKKDERTTTAPKKVTKPDLFTGTRSVDGRNSTGDHGDILRALEYLKHISAREANNNDCGDDEPRGGHRYQPCYRNPQEATIEMRSFYPTKSQSVDSQLLFQLIVIFQLLLVRIDDAHYVIAGYRIEESPSENRKNQSKVLGAEHQMQRFLSSMGLCCFGAGMILLCRKHMGYNDIRIRSLAFSKINDKKQMVGAAIKAGSSMIGLVLAKGFLSVCWMTDKIIRSNTELLEWNHQWELIHCGDGNSRDRARHYSSSVSVRPRTELFTNKTIEDSIDVDEKSRILIEYAKKHGRKSYFWRSTGEIRFLMVKRFMEIYYASVGVGVHCTKANPNSFFLPLVTGAAASFYTITGAPTPTVVNESSRDLIQHAWGMVSLPALKDLMLQASRLVKGASLADRIVLCGVPCFILSKDPAPELAAVLQRQTKARSGDSSANLSQLSTITETEIHLHTEEANFGCKSFVGSKGQYRQRDIILHLTGGGFFAHTIASDLPYLLDWSSSTGSVVICPEYSLLPEHQFPTQLNQIATIYATLANGNTGVDLGFEVNSIIVTGESAGGNLAAALCVKLAMHNIKVESRSKDSTLTSETSSSIPTTATIHCHEELPSRMPDAIMLSCPALNLTTELSHSRVIGTEDPVLPNALISAISEAYLPPGVDNKNPLVSPFFASDQVLRRFPPALLFASSKDPLLDDSVTFNERLRVLGVDSELMAVHNVPHAYLGLGTAGFPEAVQVQQYAMDWLSSKFSE
eukprot:CAMPEP_0201148384 /NCGR_PEP_ID=MMETSP0851-20130426/9840_1 /ASSEMBLY_ACC=CAM_ASM_000631 /TAXON_ID=183588 /ORGANISM="Pseudo-nitzschia fraudulenta, Strain WWA7" /LENGTH=782 /DNA_ID=CAMNT_0047424517 /DNA_START=192 /DNA_END=2540 /DNA_ORIENTATION=+